MDNQQLIGLQNLIKKWTYESATIRNAICDTSDYDEQRRLRIEYHAIDECIRELQKVINDIF